MVRVDSVSLWLNIMMSRDLSFIFSGHYYLGSSDILNQERRVRLTRHQLVPSMGLKELNLIRQQEDNINWVLWVQQVCAELVTTVVPRTKLIAKGSGDRGGWTMPSGAKEVADTDPLPVLSCAWRLESGAWCQRLGQQISCTENAIWTGLFLLLLHKKAYPWEIVSYPLTHSWI